MEETLAGELLFAGELTCLAKSMTVPVVGSLITRPPLRCGFWKLGGLEAGMFVEWLDAGVWFALGVVLSGACGLPVVEPGRSEADIADGLRDIF